MKRGIYGMIALLAICFSVSAQAQFSGTTTYTLYRADLLANIDSSALMRDLPLLDLLDGRFPVASPLARMGAPVNFPLAFVGPIPARRPTSTMPKEAKDSPADVVTARSNIYTTGEIGVFYGKSSGKFGREDFGSFIEGTVGNDRFQITAGALYQETNGRVPRFAR